MIAKLEWTQSNAQQNIEQFQNPTMGVTINNNRTTTLERTIRLLVKSSSSLRETLSLGFRSGQMQTSLVSYRD